MDWRKINLGQILTGLVLLQIGVSLLISGNHILFNSNLKLFFNQDYFMSEKLDMMLGGDYVLARRMSSLPERANYLMVSSRDTWFINYYLFPRRLFAYPGVTQEADIKQVPPTWLKERGIELIIFYGPPNVKVARVSDLPGVFK